jgi:hypothetical protein
MLQHHMAKAVKPAGLRTACVAENEERIVRAAHELFIRGRRHRGGREAEPADAR